MVPTLSDDGASSGTFTGLDGKVTIAQVDVDQSQDLANLFGIRSIPTMVIFKDGKTR